MGNENLNGSKKSDDQEIIKENLDSKIKAKKKFVSSLSDLITLTVGIYLADLIIKLIPIKSNILELIFNAAIITIVIIIKEIVVALFIFKRRKK